MCLRGDNFEINFGRNESSMKRIAQANPTHLLKWPLGVVAGVDGLVGGVLSLIFLLKKNLKLT